MFQVRQNDGLPKYSCVKCALDVKSALITKRRIIKAHKYFIEKLRKQSNPSTSNQKTVWVQRTERTISTKPPKITETRDNTETNRAAAIDYPKVSVNDSYPDSQSSSEDITTKIEIKHEVLDDTQNSNDAPIAKEQNSSCSAKEVRKNRKQVTYTCKVCNTSFLNNRKYYQHCLKHKKTKCDTCHKLIRSGNFAKHLLVHSTGSSTCNLCGATCKNIESLRGHIFYQHRNLNAYCCEECGAKFNSRYQFSLHKTRAHVGVKNFKCEICGKEFFTKHLLMKHDRIIHKKLRPYICEVCESRFPSAKGLKSHKLQHTDEKPYACDQCGEGFRQKVSLRSHLKSKHGIEEAKECICAECGKGFASNYALSVHQRLHKSIKCNVCSETFADREYLKNHIKETHGVDNESEETEENIAE